MDDDRSDAGQGDQGQRVDQAGFSQVTESHRRELHVHCYRMLGSFEDAEDLVQETFLRAWRRRETFEGRSTFRAWLYRIATNACLDLLAKRRPEPATGGEVLWLQPYPDRLLDDLAADDADEPETAVLARETIELAYVVAVQHLAPRPRAALILRDVLGWPAKDVADLLGDSVHSVNSALQRARAGMREHLPAERQEWTGGEDDDNRELVRRFTDASIATDIDTIATMLRDDVRFAMPPVSGLIVGRDAVLADWIEGGYPEMTGFRGVPMSVNRQPAVAYYHWREREAAYAPAGARRAAHLRRDDHRGDDLRRPSGSRPRLAGPARGRRGVPMSRERGARPRPAPWSPPWPSPAWPRPPASARVRGRRRADPGLRDRFHHRGATLVGVAMAIALQRWSDRPAERFVLVAVALTVLSLVPPLLWEPTPPPRPPWSPCTWSRRQSRSRCWPGAFEPHPPATPIGAGTQPSPTASASACRWCSKRSPGSLNVSGPYWPKTSHVTHPKARPRRTSRARRGWPGTLSPICRRIRARSRERRRGAIPPSSTTMAPASHASCHTSTSRAATRMPGPVVRSAGAS